MAGSPDRAAARAVTELLQRPKYELIPTRSVDEAIGHLPPATVVTITASPTHTIENTIDLAARLRRAGHQPVPHLASRMVRDRRHLRSIVEACGRADVSRVFVVGGDASEAGDYPDAVSLLRDLTDEGHPFTEIGIACYPEGHAFIPDDRLEEALWDKAPFADYMTTQLCFDAETIAKWVARRRDDGLELPVHIGIPGATDAMKLIRLATRIGLGASRRYLSKNSRLLGRLVRPGGFAPDALLDSLGPYLADPRLGVTALHISTFNQVAATEEWRRRYLEALDRT